MISISMVEGDMEEEEAMAVTMAESAVTAVMVMAGVADEMAEVVEAGEAAIADMVTGQQWPSTQQ